MLLASIYICKFCLRLSFQILHLPMLPILFQSLITLFSSMGFKNTFKMIVQYPAIILTPVFSYWTFGDPKGCCRRNPDNKLKVSFRLTWGNVVMTASGNLGLFLVHFFTKDLSDPLITKHFIIMQYHYPSNLFLHIISGSCLVVSWITLIILQNLQKVQKCCFSFCCGQVFQKTAMNLLKFPNPYLNGSSSPTQ